MQSTDSKEIDIKELFTFWLKKWKSMLVLVFIGILLAYIYLAINSNKSKDSEERIDNTQISSEQQLTQEETMAVDDLVIIYNQYCALLAKNQESCDESSLIEMSEILEDMVNVSNYVNGIKRTFSVAQLNRFYMMIGMEESVLQKQNMQSELTMELWKDKILVVFVVTAVLAHIIAYTIVYFMDETLKHNEKYVEMISVNELTRVNESAKKKRNESKFIDVESAIKINSCAIEQISIANNYRKVAIIGIDTNDNEKLASNVEIDVNYLSNITTNLNGAKDIAMCEAAFLVVRVGKTKREHLIKEAEALALRKKTVLGIIVFE